MGRNNVALVLASAAALFLLVRLVPYVVPIHARDLAQDSQAVEFTDRNGLPLGTLIARSRARCMKQCELIASCQAVRRSRCSSRAWSAARRALCRGNWNRSGRRGASAPA